MHERLIRSASLIRGATRARTSRPCCGMRSCRRCLGVHIELLDSTAGVTNLAMLQRNEVDAVSTYADIAYLASVGQLEDMAGPFDEVRAIAALPIRELQVVIAPQSPIRSIRDLRGRRVSLGPPGTGVAITAGLLLSAFGIGSHDIKTEHLAFDEAVLPVMNGEIDAAFWGGRFPNANIAAATRHGARLLQVVGPEIEQFRAEYPFLRATVIPAGTYPGIDHVVHTVGVDGIFVCRADLDERLVYNLTKAFFQAVVPRDAKCGCSAASTSVARRRPRFRCILAPRGTTARPRCADEAACVARRRRVSPPDPHNRPRRSGARTLLVRLSGSERMAAKHRGPDRAKRAGRRRPAGDCARARHERGAGARPGKP